MRTRNLTSDEVCGFCEPGRTKPSGLVLVANREQGKGAMPEYGPCPHCEAGARAEQLKTSYGPRWPDGFWQGRDIDVKPLSRGEFLLPKYENLARIRMLTRRFNGEDVDPSVGIDLADPARRMALVERELAK